MECEEFIEIVRKNQILYDLCHENYKNFKKKNKIWDQIGKEMEKTGEDMKKQWKNLRDCYSKHLRSLKTHTGQAAKNTNSYKTWPWAKQMDFLRPFLKFAKSATNVRIDDNDSNDELLASEYLPQTENLAASTNLETELNQTIREDPENVETDVEHVIPRKKKKFIKGAESSSTSGVDKVIAFLKEKPPEKEIMDATELIFLGYAKQIKTFSARRQAYTNLKISQIVMEQNVMQMKEDEEKSITSLENRNIENLSNTTNSASAASWYENFNADLDEFNN